MLWEQLISIVNYNFIWMVQEINFLQLLEKRIKGTKLSCYISKAEKYEPMHKRSMDNLLQCEMRLQFKL